MWTQAPTTRAIAKSLSSLRSHDVAPRRTSYSVAQERTVTRIEGREARRAGSTFELSRGTAAELARNTAANANAGRAAAMP